MLKDGAIGQLKYWQWLCKLGMEGQIFKKQFVNGLIDIETQ